MRLLQKFFLPLQSVKTVGWLPEWPNGADCKSAGYAFGGSNPSPPTSQNKAYFFMRCALFFSASSLPHFLPVPSSIFGGSQTTKRKEKSTMRETNI